MMSGNQDPSSEIQLSAVIITRNERSRISLHRIDRKSVV